MSLEDMLLDRLEALETRLRDIERVDLGPQVVYLTTPLTSTAWDGDAHSDEGPTQIDLSAVFGVPEGIKAVLMQIGCRDSAPLGTLGLYFDIGPNTTYYYSTDVTSVGGDVLAFRTEWVPCNANGDIAYRLNASGAGTMDCWLRVWGYAL